MGKKGLEIIYLNIPESVMRFARKHEALDAIPTGGGCDYIIRQFAKSGIEIWVVGEGGPVDTISEPAWLQFNPCGEEWDDSWQDISKSYSTVRAAMLGLVKMTADQAEAFVLKHKPKWVPCHKRNPPVSREQALESACQSALEELRKWKDFAPEDKDLPGIIKELKEALSEPKAVPTSSN